MNAYERNSNIDALITLSAHVLEDEDLETMREADVSDVEIPHRLYRKIMRRIRKHDRQTEMSKAYIYARRIAAVFLIVCSISFVFCLSVEAIRTEIWNTIVDWYEEYVEIHFESKTPAPSIIKEYREPALQPAGTDRIVASETDIGYLILYLRDGNISITYEQSVVNEGSVLQIDNENCNISEIDINGNKATLLEYDDGKISLYWLDSEYLYTMTCFDSFTNVDTFIRIAESVK